jgi:hypothetical protein
MWQWVTEMATVFVVYLEHGDNFKDCSEPLFAFGSRRKLDAFIAERKLSEPTVDYLDVELDVDEDK